jgi:hypothetical protein
MTAESVSDYRLKIKTLKHKIEKEENNYNDFRHLSEQFKTLSKNSIH